MTLKDCLLRLIYYMPLPERLEEHLTARRAIRALEEWQADPSSARPWREVFADLGVEVDGE